MISIKQEWIDSEINMRQCEEFEGWLEVTCSQSSNNKVSMNLDFDINIESNLKCGPVASRTKCHVYGLFWTIGAKRCKFFFAFENKAIYDVYIAYLEKTLQALEMDRNSKHLLSFVFLLLQSHEHQLVESVE